MEEAEESRNTCIVVIQIQRGDRAAIQGVIVDKAPPGKDRDYF